MTDYPRLAEMGIQHPDQIVRYSINSLNRVDILRIDYERPKASLLPNCRTYRFPRVQKQADAENVKKKEFVLQSNPALKEAIQELEQILENKTDKRDAAEAILDELNQLEDDLACHRAHIEKLIGKLARD